MSKINNTLMFFVEKILEIFNLNADDDDTPNFFITKLGFAGVYIIFLFLL